MRFCPLILLLSVFLACDDTGLAPIASDDGGPHQPIQTVAADGWYQTPVRFAGHSLWLDFVSVETDNFSIPLDLRQYFDSTDSEFKVIHFDSIRVVNHSDRDTVYQATGFYYYSNGIYHKRFYFPDGYTDRFQPTQPLNLSVFIHYE